MAMGGTGALGHWGRAVEQLEKHLETEGTEG